VEEIKEISVADTGTSKLHPIGYNIDKLSKNYTLSGAFIIEKGECEVFSEIYR